MTLEDAEPYSNFLTHENFNSEKITLSLSLSKNKNLTRAHSVSFTEILSLQVQEK
jgi:hypothetical protein